jgi:HSP20 family protein
MATFRWRSPFYENLKEFRELDRLQEEVNRLYENFFGKSPYRERTDVFPSINISEDRENLHVSAELPGVDAKDVHITAEEDGLTIKGTRKLEAADQEASYHRREREGGSFNRKINLPTRIIPEKVTAETKNGILTIVLPKAEEMKPKTVEIKAR